MENPSRRAAYSTLFNIAMLFNSYTFIVFFVCVLMLHSLPLPWWVKKLHLLIASCLFYAAWNPPFVLILWFTMLLDWFIGGQLGRVENPRGRKALFAASLCANLGMLGFFKYGGFVLDNFLLLMEQLGVHIQLAKPDIILPVGISFYTFQTLSYIWDIYRRKSKPCSSFLDYSLYVTFFPQLVAGPIIRGSTFLPQCLEARTATLPQFAWGCCLLVLGLFEKVVIADGLLAPVSDAVFAMPRPDAISAWCGTLAFAGQVFCDFAGYSTCAIGAALCFGFHLPDNFRFPFAAIGFADLWQRWHISLSTWLRDYLYFSLGGSRAHWLRASVNVISTMVICGLWHGAAWTFVFWGALQGVLLASERGMRAVCGRAACWGWTPMRLGLALLTFAVFCHSLVFIRGKTFGQAFWMWTSMAGAGAGATSSTALSLKEAAVPLAIMPFLFLCHWLMRDTSLEAVAERVPWWGRSLAIAGMLFCIATMSGDDRAFIYFQF